MQQTQQQQLDESIERTRAIMQQFKTIPNVETALMNLLQNNPQLGWLSSSLRNGNNLEGIAKQMAQSKNLDINYVLKSLSNV